MVDGEMCGGMERVGDIMLHARWGEKKTLRTLALFFDRLLGAYDECTDGRMYVVERVGWLYDGSRLVLVYMVLFRAKELECCT